MKITLNNQNEEFPREVMIDTKTWEDDCTEAIETCLEALLAFGFHPESVKRCLIDIADSYKDEDETKEAEEEYIELKHKFRKTNAGLGE